ncbi:MAG TPA: FAD-binding oxidoreductase [Thermomicrobiales bacterium]|nr:FAD-binding oxidoreductase [Thermomicrobiales bacterium]
MTPILTATRDSHRIPCTDRPDVVVIGGGVVGCSIAYRLSLQNRRVLLLEKRGLAAGASGRNGGLTGAGSSLHTAAGRAVSALTVANLALMRTLEDELGVDIQLRLPGTLDIATTPEQYRDLAVGVEAQRAMGSEVHLLDTHEARKLMPALTPDILGAEFAPGRGHLWPFALVHAFADAARRLGAGIRTGVTVDRLLIAGDRITGVEVAGETIHAGEVVLATNAYTPALLPDLPAGAIVPARGQILVTEPLPPTLPHPFGTNYEKEYGRQTAHGPIICGGYRRLDVDEGLGHTDEAVTPPVLAGIAQCLTGLFPSLRDVRVVRCWAGIMGFTADGLPLIGRWPAYRGLTVAAGFNGGGFSWAATAGQVVADLVSGEDPGFDLAPFDPGRFLSGATAWTNPYTAGEQSHTRESVVLGHTTA